MTINVDVAVVGFGPGGEVLASLLGQAGHSVVVFEKFPAPYGLPRMSTLDGEIARLMQHTGDPGKALAEALPQAAAFLYGADGEIALEDDLRYTIGGQPASLSLHQPNIEAAMEERIAACPSVEVRWGTEVVGIDDLGDCVRVTARRLGDSSDEAAGQVVAARYAVGMDGASSFVRTALGIDLEVVHLHDDQWILTDFDIIDPRLPEPPNTVHFDPAGPWMSGPNGAGRCRTDVRVMNDDLTSDKLLDHDLGYAFLEQKLGIPRDSVRISRRVLYRFRSQYARSFRQGRVFLGGDAAHAMVPGMAQGSCSAMRDGANLAWKLDLVLSSRAGAELLDTYEPERLQHVIPLVRGSLAAWTMATETDPQKAAQRDALLRSGQAPRPKVPPLATGILHRDPGGTITPPVGSVSPQGRVKIGDREDLLDNLVGFGFQLISTLPLDQTLSEAQLAALHRIGAKVLVLGTEPGQVQDTGNTYTRFLAEHDATTLLARPDFYLFGTADGPHETAALVDDLITQLALTQPTPPQAQEEAHA